MKLEGAKRCFQFLQQVGLTIGVFVSDHQTGIAKWIRETCRNTKHYFNIWHVAWSLTKKLLAVGKEKGCKIIMEWNKGIHCHLYWSATSTDTRFGDLEVAIFSWDTWQISTLTTLILITTDVTMRIFSQESGSKVVFLYLNYESY